jgi:hypothetical protein
MVLTVPRRGEGLNAETREAGQGAPAEGGEGTEAVQNKSLRKVIIEEPAVDAGSRAVNRSLHRRGKTAGAVGR